MEATQERAAFRPSEVAARLGCSRDTVERAIAAGDLKSFLINRARFISARELERFIAEREAEACN
jgi:excisionase family DNA binding protein